MFYNLSTIGLFTAKYQWTSSSFANSIILLGIVYVNMWTHSIAEELIKWW